MSRTRLILAIEPVIRASGSEEYDAGARRAALAVAMRAAQHFPRWAPGAEPPMETLSAEDRKLVLLGPSPRQALRVCLYLRAHLWVGARHMDLRIGAGIGQVNLVGDVDLRYSSGPAFQAADRALASLGRVARMAPGWPEPPVHAPRTRALFALADAVARRWTVTQADLARDALFPGAGTLERLAREAGREPRSVVKSWRDAGGWAIEEAIAVLEGER